MVFKGKNVKHTESLLFGDIIMNVISEHQDRIPLSLEACHKILSKCQECYYEITSLQQFGIIFDLFINRLGLLEEVSDEFKSILHTNRKTFKDISIAFLVT
ncbi:unknown [Gryllus bimaculatus nudivirus]|uniref:Uncharacterized protein n=1 Tax=Gryllus bimaculatus nudivirus TaxID=432587 RepID=A4L252_9VIRU|nr:hypothetical protein GrBNV_gp89 [Gryllus bimaculatus nudivirus]ABO45422.1 unknown [Gryllus bimaculatus nudivirus]